MYVYVYMYYYVCIRVLLCVSVVVCMHTPYTLLYAYVCMLCMCIAHSVRACFLLLSACAACVQVCLCLCTVCMQLVQQQSWVSLPYACSVWCCVCVYCVYWRYVLQQMCVTINNSVCQGVGVCTCVLSSVRRHVCVCSITISIVVSIQCVSLFYCCCYLLYTMQRRLTRVHKTSHWLCLQGVTVRSCVVFCVMRTIDFVCIVRNKRGVYYGKKFFLDE